MLAVVADGDGPAGLTPGEMFDMPYRRHGRTLLALVFAMLAATSVVASATVTATLPQVDYLDNPAGPYPGAEQVIGSFSYTPPAVVTAAQIHGTFGNPGTGSTAPVRIFLNGTLIATCMITDPCYADGPTPWSFNIPSSMFATLGAGTATLSFIQDNATYVRLGVTTLVLNPAPPMQVPATGPAGLIALAVVLAAFGLVATSRRRSGRA